MFVTKLKAWLHRLQTPVVIPLAALVVIAVALLVFEHHQLWKIQELNLFLSTSLFFHQQMVVSGGLLTWLGTFFTQFLFMPWLGVLLLCGWWCLLMWLLKRTFRIPQQWTVLLLVPVVLLLVANVDMGYWIYTMKLRGWFFVPTIGTTAVAALLWVFRVLTEIKSEKIRLKSEGLFVLLTVVVGYPLLGAYALAAALLMAVWVWRLTSNRLQAALTTLVAVLSVVTIPLLCYRYVYCQTNLVNIYYTALPLFRLLETYYAYYIPYYILAAFFLALTIVRRRESEVKGGSIACHTLPREKLFTLHSSFFTLLVLAVGVYLSWFKDENFHHELAMQHYIEQVEWGDVLKEAESQKDEPTRAIVMMRNLALSRLGRQGDFMYSYPGGSKRPASVFPIQSSLIVGSLIYYNYGMLNDSHHMCIEAGVEYGWRVEHLKNMARCALMSGDARGMRKFTGLLKHTFFYGKWAALMENLLQHPKQLAEAFEFAPVLRMLHHEDMIGSDRGYMEKYLMHALANRDSDDAYFQEQCLLATLWTKNPQQFWARFSKYVRLHPKDRIPRYYQEAAWFFANQDNPGMFSLPIDASVKDTYKRFMEQIQHYDGRDMKEVQQALYPLFGDTFFYDYYLMSNLTYF